MKEYVAKIRILIAKDRIEDALAFLLEDFKEKKVYNEVILLVSDFNKYKKDKMLGVLSGEGNISRSIFVVRLLEFLDKIEREDEMVFNVKEKLQEATDKIQHQDKVKRILSISGTATITISIGFLLNMLFGLTIAVTFLVIVLIFVIRERINI